MIKKIAICSIIALLLVPASVLAAVAGGQNESTACGQGQCLNNGLNCTNPSCTGTPGFSYGNGYGRHQSGGTHTKGSPDGQCTSDQNHARLMTRLHEGTCTACKTIP
jgi:hypothetical protein